MIVFLPYQMQNEEEYAGNDQVVTTDAPSAPEHHDSWHDPNRSPILCSNVALHCE